MSKSILKAILDRNNKIEYSKKLEDAAIKTGIPEIMDIINSTEDRCIMECFGENPTPESLIEIYNEYYKEA